MTELSIRDVELGDASATTIQVSVSLVAYKDIFVSRFKALG
jgi:hypothetical protein